MAQCEEKSNIGCFTPFVGTCEKLAAYMPVGGCSDENVAWIDTTDKWLTWQDEQTRSQVLKTTEEVRIHVDDAGHHTERFTVVPSETSIEVDWRRVHASRGYLPDAELFIPEHMVADLDLPVHSVDVIGPPGQEFATTVGLVAQERGLEAPGWSYSDYANVVSIRTMLGSTGAALVAVIVLIVTLSVLDWLRESRRPRMRLFAVGLPRAVIARTYLVQFGIPLLGAVLLGGLLGLAGIRAYEVLGGDVESVGAFNLPSTYWWLVGALVIGVLMAAGLAGLTARERMLPKDLRQE